MPPSPEPSDEQFVRLLARHELSVRSYIRASLWDPEEVAEVMQRSTIIAWKKFSTLENPEETFVKWLCVIARYEILMFRRSKARDRLVLNEEILETIADEGMEENTDRAKWLKLLQNCLRELPKDRRKLIVSAYEDGASIKTLAIEMGKKPNALYQLLSRIRIQLAACIEQNSTSS